MNAFKFLIFILCISFFPLHAHNFEQAYAHYLQGEQSNRFEDRSRYFNEALKAYSLLDYDHPKLYFNRANCYYQLGEMGMAIWCYQKAKTLDPRNKKIEANLKKAYQKAHLPQAHIQGIFENLFFFHYKWLSSEKKVALFLLGFISFALLSLYIWIEKSLFRSLGIAFLVFSSVIGSSLILDHIHLYSYAILVEPSLLRCDAGKQYKEIDKDPLLAGQKVKVIELGSDPKWVRIKAEQGKEGYLLRDKLRLL